LAVSILSIQGSGSKFQKEREEFGYNYNGYRSQSFLFKAVVLNYLLTGLLVNKIPDVSILSIQGSGSKYTKEGI
jgi:hypothetical protein